MTHIDKRSSIFDVTSPRWNGSERHVRFKMNADGNYFKSSEDFLELINLYPEDAAYGGILHRIHEQERRRFEMALEEATRAKTEIVGHRCQLQLHTGQYVEAIFYMFPLMNRDQVFEWCGVIKLVGNREKTITSKGKKVQASGISFGLVG